MNTFEAMMTFKRTKVLVAIAIYLISINTVLSQVSEVYENALQSYNENKIDESYIHLKNVLKNKPDHLPSKILMGRVLFNKGLAQAAIEELEESMSFGADINLLVVPLLQSKLLLGDLQYILSFKENDIRKSLLFEVWILKATASGKLGEISDALEYFYTAIKSFPDNIKVLNSFAYFYIQQKKYEDAYQLILESENIDSNNSKTLHLKAQYFDAINERDTAYLYYKKAYSLNESDGLLIRSLINAHMIHKNYEDATPLIDKILKETPDDPYIMLYKAMITADSDMGEVSGDLYRKVQELISLVPEEVKIDHTELIFADALASYELGNYEKSRDALEKYLLHAGQNLQAIDLLAQSYLHQNTVYKARSLLNKNIDVVKSNLRLSLTLCQLHLEMNQSFKCLSLIEELRKIYGELLPIDLMRSKVYQSRGLYKEALEIFDSLDTQGLSPQSLLRYVELLLLNDKNDKALSVIDSIISNEPSNYVFLNTKADILISQKEYEGARNYVDQALKINSNFIPANLNNIKLLLREGELKEAENQALITLNKSPENINAIRLYVRALINQSKVIKARKTLEQSKSLDGYDNVLFELSARLYVIQKDYSKALKEYKALNRQTILNPKYVLGLAEVYSKMGNVKAAQQQLRILYNLWNKSSEKLLRLSQLQTTVEDFEGAIRSINKALLLSPNNISISLGLMKLQIQNKQANMALKLANKWLKKYPDNKNIVFMAAEALTDMYEREKAQKLYLKALELDDNFVLAAIRLGQLAEKGVGSASFESRIKAILREKPDAHIHRSLLADYYTASRQYSKARVLYEMLVNVDNLPGMAKVYNNYAKTLFDTAPGKSLEFSNKAVNINSKSAEYLSTKGWSLVKLERFSDALQYLRKAHALDASSLNIRYKIAFTLFKEDRLVEATRELDSILSTKDEFELRQEAEELKVELSSRV